MGVGGVWWGVIDTGTQQLKLRATLAKALGALPQWVRCRQLPITWVPAYAFPFKPAG